MWSQDFYFTCNCNLCESSEQRDQLLRAVRPKNASSEVSDAWLAEVEEKCASLVRETKQLESLYKCVDKELMPTHETALKVARALYVSASRIPGTSPLAWKTGLILLAACKEVTIFL